MTAFFSGLQNPFDFSTWLLSGLSRNEMPYRLVSEKKPLLPRLCGQDEDDLRS